VKVAVRQCPSSDSELTAAAVAGEPGAFAELYELHADRVFAQLTRLIGPVPDREDVVQQVFLALHRALPRFRGDSSLATFLGRITINIAYDHLRRRMRHSARHDATPSMSWSMAIQIRRTVCAAAGSCARSCAHETLSHAPAGGSSRSRTSVLDTASTT
jgi:RNA polymerase sigma factor (sigma-70 family)